jgi:large subunit ribosomal protein L38e
MKDLAMPKQIYDVEKFLEMSEDAVECRVKRGGEKVKLKLRTSKYLYTIILDPQEAEAVLQQVKCQIVEARPEAEED